MPFIAKTTREAKMGKRSFRPESWERQTARSLRPKTGFSGFMSTYEKGKLIGWATAEISKMDGRPAANTDIKFLAQKLTGLIPPDINSAWEALYRLRFKMTGGN